ncbi:MAG: amidase family protein [Rhodobacterales bacterium]|jgi:amidase|nr:amidase family protein [Pseudomonadota bacterium]MDA1285624.1 amidase family protein [Pseudomonadota bacterium]HBN30843.1 amidase [Paracoccaceae bacterium]
MSELWHLTATEIANAVHAKQLSAVDVTEAHLARLDQVNPALNAVVQDCAALARAAAKEVDAKIAQGIDPGPMAGVPVTIKVNVDQVGLATTNGLVLQKDLIADSDNPVVANIRKSGAVIVGRTNTPAFSLRWFTKNNLHGQTLNPRDKSLTPGGSSGGASAAVASGICAIGHGTDIGGSIRYPAYACGLHGLRPTLGRIPAYNASGAERNIGGQLMAVSGPIARSIADLRLALSVMAAEDPRDPWWVPAPMEGPVFAKRVALCVAPEGMKVAPEVKAALMDAAHRLEAAGWQVEDIPIPPMQEAADINAQLWMAEMRAGAAEMVALENEADSQFVFAQMTARSAEIDINGLLNALKNRATLVRQWQVFLASHPVVLCPVSGELPFTQQQDVQSEAAFEAIMQSQLTQLALPALGLPGLTVATGYAGQTPVGVQLIGARYREDILLAAGEAIEAAGPKIMPSDPA